MSRRLPPLIALKAFEAAARHMSFVRAADELAVTPAAVSHQVKQLEEILGVALFRRLPRGLSLTDAGRAYLPGLTDGFDRIAQATVGLTARTTRGRLVVSVLPSFSMRWLVPRLGDFQQRYPDIDVVVRAEMGATEFNRTQEVDVALRYGPGHYPDLASELILTEEVTPVCSPALLNGPQPLRSFHDLRRHTLLHDSDTRPRETWLRWSTWLKAEGVRDVDATRGLSFNDTAQVLTAAAAGYGVALGRTALMLDDLAAGRLVRPFRQSRPADNDYYFVTRPELADMPVVATFRSWIQEMARAFQNEQQCMADAVRAPAEQRRPATRGSGAVAGVAGAA